MVSFKMNLHGLYHIYLAVNNIATLGKKLKETGGHLRHTTRVMFGVSSIHSVYK